MRDIKECIAIVGTYPNGRITPELLLWLQNIGMKDVNQLYTHCDKRLDLCMSYNWAIKYIALPSKAKCFIFADNDIKPDLRTSAPLLDLETDIACVEYPTAPGHEKSWASTVAFHCGLWICRREVLERMERPWFRPNITDEGCGCGGCICTNFAARAMRQGYTVSHAGWADHTP